MNHPTMSLTEDLLKGMTLDMLEGLLKDFSKEQLKVSTLEFKKESKKVYLKVLILDLTKGFDQEYEECFETQEQKIFQLTGWT